MSKVDGLLRIEERAKRASRLKTGWMIADRESSDLATRFIEEICTKQRIKPGQLTVHANRGSSMMSKPLALLMEDLGIRKSHSRPRVSNDNPFSESQFKTMKYRHDYPLCANIH